MPDFRKWFWGKLFEEFEARDLIVFFTVGAVFALLAAGAVACLLLFGEYAHRSRVGGQLVPDLGVSTVVAPTSGMVGRMTVEEGASVARDQALVRIDLPRVAASGADAHTGIGRGLDDRDSSSAQLAQAQLAQLAVQEQGQRRQLAMLRTELGQVRAGIATRDAQVRLGRETADRYREVAASGYVSVVQVRQQEQAMLEMLNARQVLERQATALAREIAGLDAMAKTLRQRVTLLERELRATAQRVNLFEKVKIPEAKENIRVIGIYLGDQQTSAVVRGKIAKKKLQEVGR